MKHSFESLEELLHTVRKTGNPSPDDRRAVRRALSGLFATAVTTSTAVAAAATKTALFSSFLWPFATGALLGGAVVATTTVASHTELFQKFSSPAATVAVPPAVAPRPAPPVAPSELAPPGELPSAAAFPSDEKPPEPRAPEVRPPAPPRTHAPAAVVSAPPPAAVVSLPPAEPHSPQTLEAESRALAEAQRALRDEDAEWALSMLVEQDRRFAGGVLAEERAAARVLAACAAGRLADGRAAAERFQRQYPRSLHTERVRQACEP